MTFPHSFPMRDEAVACVNAEGKEIPDHAVRRDLRNAAWAASMGTMDIWFMTCNDLLQMLSESVTWRTTDIIKHWFLKHLWLFMLENILYYDRVHKTETLYPYMWILVAKVSWNRVGQLAKRSRCQLRSLHPIATCLCSCSGSIHGSSSLLICTTRASGTWPQWLGSYHPHGSPGLSSWLSGIWDINQRMGGTLFSCVFNFKSWNNVHS